MEPAASIALLEESLRPRMAVPEADLFRLATTRAEIVQSKLLTDTGIDPSRVFLASPTEGKADGCRRDHGTGAQVTTHAGRRFE